MPAVRIPRDNPASKRQFHDILLDWLANTNDKYVGSEDVDERTPWIHVQDGSSLFILHSDTKRAAVLQYLKLVAVHGADIAWTITLSQRGKMTAVAFGPSEERHKPFYLYVT